MEEYTSNSKKRERDDDSEMSPNSCVSKRIQSDSELNFSEWTHLNSVERYTDSELNSLDANVIRNDILDILDQDPENDSVSQDLDSVIKSFEEEILHPTQPELGYLLGASDDDLGLPPAVSTSGEQPENDVSNSVTVGLVDMLGFEDGIPSYDPFELGIGEGVDCNGGGDFVALDGLFEYGEASDFSWQAESLPAL